MSNLLTVFRLLRDKTVQLIFAVVLAVWVLLQIKRDFEQEVAEEAREGAVNEMEKLDEERADDIRSRIADRHRRVLDSAPDREADTRGFRN